MVRLLKVEGWQRFLLKQWNREGEDGGARGGRQTNSTPVAGCGEALGPVVDVTLEPVPVCEMDLRSSEKCSSQ